MLTGLRRQVANYPGVTVEKASGIIRHNTTKLEVLDLPGAYFYSDYCRPSIRTLTGSPDNLAETTVLPTGSIASAEKFAAISPSSIIAAASIAV